MPRDAATPSVDIVVSSYNHGRFVADAVASALGQTHRPLRVIVVDDGSTDGSLETLAAFGTRIELLTRPNGGQAAAINDGFAHGTGDVVIFLDADDLLEPEAAASAVAAFVAGPDLSRVSFRLRVIDADGTPTGELKPPPGTAMPEGDLRRAMLTAPLDLPWLPTSGNAYRRAALGPLVPIPTARYRRGADWYLVHVTPLVGPVAFLEATLGGYRVHDANGHERSDPLDLGRIRRVVSSGAAVNADVARLGRELGLAGADAPAPRSVSDLAHRLASLRLGPGHPRPEDRRAAVALAGAQASLARADIALPGRVALASWFVAVGVLPRRAARPAIAALLDPGQRARAAARLGGLRARVRRGG